MQDKQIINQFAAKISKAKILYDSTQATCIKLRRQAAQLQRQYATIRNQREAAENMEKSLQNQLEMTEKAQSDTHDKCRKEENQLAQLRNNRKELKREKDIEQHTLLKNTLELEEHTKKREELELLAKSLSDKLEGVTAEKEVLQDEFSKTESAIKKYNANISDLENEIHQMREVISKNTVPVCNMTESQMIKSNMNQ